MKISLKWIVLAMFCLFTGTHSSPGDNLNFYSVVKVFQESKTLEGFEKKINDQNANTNYLNFDGDDYVDCITLRVALNTHEIQDVAVFFQTSTNTNEASTKTCTKASAKTFSKTIN